MGLALAAVLAALEPYVKLKLHTNGLCTDSINAGAVLFLFFLALLVWPMKSVRGWKILDSRDLAVIFSMLAVACAIPSHGLLAPLLSMVTGASYYATPNNHFEEMVLARLPDWLLVKGDAARYFYERLPQGESIPLDAWLKPAMAWGLLLAGVYTVQISLAILLYEQWTQQERLAFPLVRLPLEMVKAGDEKAIRRGRFLFRDPLFWAGLVLTLLIVGSRGLTFYFPDVPTLPRISARFPILRDTTTIHVIFSFVIAGFSYLLNTRVLLSVWFFHLLMKVVSGMMTLNGVALEGENERWGGSTLLNTHINGGSMIVLVLFGFWMAREHWAGVFREGWRDGTNRRYRGALIALASGLLLTAGWLFAVGVPMLLTPLVVFAAFITLVGMTRIVAQAGVGFMCSGMPPAAQVYSAVGTGPLGPNGVAALGSLYTWAFEFRTTVMASTSGALRLSEQTRTRLGIFPLAAALVITLVVSSVCIVRLAYHEGGANLRSNWFIHFARIPWDIVVSKSLSPIMPEMVTERCSAMLAGAGVMSFLIALTQKFPWFPMHYIGFPIADIWMMNQIWASVFLAWVCKLLVLRYGGARTYKRSISFALGLIMGQILAAAAFMIADSITGRVGHFMDVGLG